MPPIASHGLANAQGELATAKAFALENSIFCLSTYGSRSISEIAAVKPDSPKFFQIYLSKIDHYNENLIRAADQAGFKAIIITADSTLAAYREADVKNNFKFPLAMPNLTIAQFGTDADSGTAIKDDGTDIGSGHSVAEVLGSARQDISTRDIASIRSYTNLPIIIKGIQHPDDALLAIKHGADAVWVSNHGGRQLDGGPGSFEVLNSIAVAVNKQGPIIFDSGIRRGEHIFKALAHGADIVGIGRPSIYGLNLGGAQGVQAVIEHFKKELTITMQLAGAKDIDAIKNTVLLRESDL
jgi:isopentenyl diphosphate isomerase/L-lactate dehydrogenase-like FMN-dependent dehydrogenase